MTPYVLLQEAVIHTLRKIQDHNPKKLKELANKYCFADSPKISAEDYNFLLEQGLPRPDSCEEELYDEFLNQIICEQLDNTTEFVVIRNLLGSRLYHQRPIGYEEYLSHHGSGQNTLRTCLFAQPGALKKGDRLVTGDRLLSEPREGGNGYVLLHLTGGLYGHWIDVPARIPIALFVKELQVPLELLRE